LSYGRLDRERPAASVAGRRRPAENRWTSPVGRLQPDRHRHQARQILSADLSIRAGCLRTEGETPDRPASR